jgi:ABC-2 type transport system ATP-binding protein
MSEPLVELRGVTKTFRARRTLVTALHEATFTVRRGDVFGLLGANGAGKTTAMRCLLGLSRIDGGELRVFGRAHPNRRELFGRAAHLPEEPQMFAGASGRETLVYHGRLCGLDARTLTRRVGETIEQVGLVEAADRPVGGYSKGMKQRLGIAAAILSEPEIIFLDEPTRGLDPIGRRQVRDLLAALAERGVTLFLNSHLLGEIERLCNRVAILVRGEVRAEGSLADLLTAKAGLFVRFALPDGVDPAMFPGAEHADGGLWKLAVTDTAALAELAGRIAVAGGRVVAAQTERVDLEDFFLQVVRAAEEEK